MSLHKTIFIDSKASRGSQQQVNGRPTPLCISLKPGIHWLSGKLQDRKGVLQGKADPGTPVEKQAIFENHHDPVIDREI